MENMKEIEISHEYKFKGKIIKSAVVKGGSIHKGNHNSRTATTNGIGALCTADIRRSCCF